jgi:hypothetical protein
MKDPRHKAISDEISDQINRALTTGGLESLSTAQLLGLVLNILFRSERTAHLETTQDDKGNGSYDRTVNVGSLPVPVEG